MVFAMALQLFHDAVQELVEQQHHCCNTCEECDILSDAPAVSAGCPRTVTVTACQQPLKRTAGVTSHTKATRVAHSAALSTPAASTTTTSTTAAKPTAYSSTSTDDSHLMDRICGPGAAAATRTAHIDPTAFLTGHTTAAAAAAADNGHCDSGGDCLALNNTSDSDTDSNSDSAAASSQESAPPCTIDSGVAGDAGTQDSTHAGHNTGAAVIGSAANRHGQTTNENDIANIDADGYTHASGRGACTVVHSPAAAAAAQTWWQPADDLRSDSTSLSSASCSNSSSSSRRGSWTPDATLGADTQNDTYAYGGPQGIEHKSVADKMLSLVFGSDSNGRARAWLHRRRCDHCAAVHEQSQPGWAKKQLQQAAKQAKAQAKAQAREQAKQHALQTKQHAITAKEQRRRERLQNPAGLDKLARTAKAKASALFLRCRRSESQQNLAAMLAAAADPQHLETCTFCAAAAAAKTAQPTTRAQLVLQVKSVLGLQHVAVAPQQQQ
ncbi:hypothetical protein RI367_007070 [Sorochytrium milnesiophthora]